MKTSLCSLLFFSFVFVTSDAFAAAPKPILKCGGDKITITVDVEKGTGKFSGAKTQGEAIDGAVKNAVETDILNQFSCEECPEDQPKGCDKKVEEIDIGTSSLDYPSRDCESTDKGWTCEGNVTFSGNPKATAYCTECPDGSCVGFNDQGGFGTCEIEEPHIQDDQF